MRIFFFYLLMCLTACAISVSASAGPSLAMAHDLKGNIGISEQVSPPESSRQQPELSLVTGNEQRLICLIDELTDIEDTDHPATPKGKLPSRHHAIHNFICGPASLKYCTQCFKTPPFFFRPASDRCILQSVFRI